MKKKEKKPKGKEKGGERIVMREGKNWEFTKTKLEQRRDRGRELKKKKNEKKNSEKTKKKLGKRRRELIVRKKQGTKNKG